MTVPFALPGPAGRVPAGFVRIPAGARVLRCHRPGYEPGWFGPAIGSTGENRFDPPHPRRAGDPGVCYLAEHLGGAIHETVLRGSRHRALSRITLSARHAIRDASLHRDVVLIDLVNEPGAHGQQLADLAQRPDLTAKLSVPKGLVYPQTQTLAGVWMNQNAAAAFPIPGGKVDGVFYVSRFSPAQRCIALWDIAKTALQWYAPIPLGDRAELETTLHDIGISLLD